MNVIYQKFCKETFNDQGELADLEITCGEHFNFAYDVVDEIAKEEPDRTALVWCDKHGEERTFTFRDLSTLSSQAANVFRKFGIGHGDKVMLILKRHYQYWYALLGLHKLGAVAIPATHMLTERDIAYRVKTADIRIILCTPEENIPAYVEEARKECPELSVCMTVKGGRDGFIDFDREMQEADTAFERVMTQNDDPMLLYFTSGTTGEPKGVLHDYAYPLGHIITAEYWQCVVDGGLHLTLADTGWAKAAWGKIYGQWLCGSAVMAYDYDHFYANEILHIIEKYRVTSFCAPPTIYRYLVRTKLSKYDLSSLQQVTTAGEAMSEDTFRAFRDATGLEIREGFGQTETTLTLANLKHAKLRVGSMGKPTPYYHLDIVDDDNNPVGPNQEGEIILLPRGNSRQVGLFSGYADDPEQYRYVWRDGIYHTGDLAYKDEEGYYWFVSRKDDVIKSSGYRIGPSEVENILSMHPAVLECAVTGVPSEKRGYLVKATIVLSEGYTAGDQLKTDIQDFVKREAAPYKYPRVIEFVDSLPKTTNGKIRRDEIRRMDRTKLFRD
ncbi:MAG: AMP-binding protein [bacterium]|nr:AMP-binding protein [bacterium]